MTEFVSHYFATVTQHLETVFTQSGEAIHQAAQSIAAALAQDKDFMTFGSGHSELIAKEAFWRAGGFAPAIHIQDHTGGDLERLEGVAKLILGHYVLRPGSAIIIISNSGVNPVPIEAAQLAHEAGLTVISMSSIQHYLAEKSRHSSGKKLHEFADIAIDTFNPRGDAALRLPNSGLKVGSNSTVVGAAIMQAIITQAAALLDAQGITPPLLVSANVPEGDAHNLALKQQYFNRLSRYQVDTADVHLG